MFRFLRREKEIAEARFEVAQAESTRLRQQFDHMQKQLDETTKTLTEEREKVQVDTLHIMLCIFYKVFIETQLTMWSDLCVCHVCENKKLKTLCY